MKTNLQRHSPLAISIPDQCYLEKPACFAELLIKAKQNLLFDKEPNR